MKARTLGLGSFLLTLVACTSTQDTQATQDDAVTGGLDMLRVAVASEATAIDPHYSFTDTNIAVGSMMFESLYRYGPNKELQPLLATKGAPTSDPKVWSFSLKKDVRFHSGKPFTKADVLCNMRRVASYELHAGGYKGLLRSIDMASTEKLNGGGTDPLELKVATNAPTSFLPTDLANLFLTSCESTEKASAIEVEDPARDKKVTSAKILAAFASGELADGTGPYVFQSFRPLSAGAADAKALVKANPGYHGARPQFASIEVVPVPDDTARTNRLLAGEFQLVAGVPMNRMEELASKGFDVEKTRGLRVMHMWMYQKDDGREANPVHVPVTDEAGNKQPNPFVSPSFRKAFSLAIDRDVVVRAVDGAGVTTDQMLPEGRVGHLPARADNPFDLEAARKAFAAASSADGLSYFRDRKLTMTIHGPNDRYPGDAKVLATVAELWTAAFGDFTVDGVHYAMTVKAASEPKVSYFANQNKYLTGFLGGGIANGHAESALSLYLVAGSSLNQGNYVNEDVTAKYKAGTSNVDSRASDATLTDALRTALDDYALIPIYNPLVSWASAKTVSYTPRIDDLTLFHDIRRR